MRELRSVLILLSAGLMAGSAHAGPYLDQTGTAPATLAPLQHYGVDSPTRSALRGLVPKGWNIYLHRKARLPEAVSWKATDTWVEAVENIVKQAGLIAKIDWDRQELFLRPAESAASEGATATPPAKANAFLAAPVRAADLFKDAALRFGFGATWQASKDYVVADAVAQGGASIEEDVKRLVDALGGAQAPLVARIDLAARSLLVTDATGPSEPRVQVVGASPAQPPSVAPGPPPTQQVLRPTQSPSGTMVAEPPAPAPAPLTLTVKPGERASEALTAYLQTLGWRIKWEADSDLRAGSEESIQAASVTELLTKLLAPFGLYADVWPKSKWVVVSPNELLD